MKVLVVVDMQNDFIDGALGTKEAVSIVSNVIEKIKTFNDAGNTVFYTRDTHKNNYMDTQEGKNLPVPHCIKNTEGWELHPDIEALRIQSSGYKDRTIDKPAFGSLKLGQELKTLDERLRTQSLSGIESVTLIGLCTDICVISNAMIIKASLPEIPVIIDPKCCAGVTPESHSNALKAMECCQIIIE